MTHTVDPLVSVIVPLYNKENWIKRCIDSIVGQSYNNLQILIINDGSTDQSLEIVSAMKDRRIEIIGKPNGGVSSARNLGMERAKGEFIAFLDADDIWLECHIALLMDGFQMYPKVAIIANKLEDVLNGTYKEAATAMECNELKDDVTYSKEAYLLSLSKDQFPLHIGSTMYRRSLLEAQQLQFDETMKLGEDVNFMLRVSRWGECLLSDYTGFVYCHDDEQSAMHNGSKSAVLTPQFFKGLSMNKWKDEEQAQVIKFIRREYIKKAYQNRGLTFDKNELSCKVGGGVEIGKWMAIVYLLIRYTPSVIFSFAKMLKGKGGV